jgi:predicted dehydrogenase
MAGKGFQVLHNEQMNEPHVGVGVLGYGFMGKVHSNAYIKIPYAYAEPPAYPRLIAMCGRSDEGVRDAARRFGFRGYYTDWKELVADPEIDIFDNCTPDDMHAAPSIAAARAGKHVLCEKPLAMTVADAKKMLQAVEECGVKHMLCHNYRFMPAVRLAKELIENGEIGMVYQFRGRYLQEVGRDPEEAAENVWYASGTKSGVLLGIGCHIIDLARFLAGEIASVQGMLKTFNTRRKTSGGKIEEVRADEVNCAIVEFESGAVGTLESAGISTGRKNQCTWEINGSKGSMYFDLADLNNLSVYRNGSPVRGFTAVSVTEPSHPLQTLILPPGHIAGWEYGHVHAIGHFIDCVVKDRPVAPYGADFNDGYRVQLIMESIVTSSESGRKVKVSFS